MACTLVVQPREKIETTINRWTEILAFLRGDKDLTKQRGKLFQSFDELKKEAVKKKTAEYREGDNEALRLARRKRYTPLDNYLRYLFDQWSMAFETYQVLEFIFRASVESHERNLFDYGPRRYAEAMGNVKGSPTARYGQILNLVQQFYGDSFLGLEDIRPTKFDYVRDLNDELRGHVQELEKVHQEILRLQEINPAFKNLEQGLGKTIKELERWAYGKILGQETKGKFLSFRDGQVIVDHRNFIYFKVYILVFMGTFGEFTRKATPEKDELFELAARKLKFESQSHFDFDIESTFLNGRERFAEEERQVESLPFDRGFLDEALLDYIVERNEDLLAEAGGELPFHLLPDFSRKRPA